jgi:ATP-dependent DNA helicase PIF1
VGGASAVFTHFGGIQVVIVGDPAQLPPIALPEGNESSFKAPQRFFFEQMHPELPNSYAAGNFEVITLDRVFRQTDQMFLNILQCAREAKPFDDWPGECQVAFLERCIAPPADLVLTKLCVTNKEVDANNMAELGKLTGPKNQYSCRFFVGTGAAKIQHCGRELTDADRERYKLTSTLEGLLESALKDVQDVTLKVGAVVMISCNMSPHLYRGLIGTVKELTPKSAAVTFSHGDEDIQHIEVRQADAENKDSFVLTNFMPLRLAWSITIHRAQGATISAARVTLEPRMMPGSAYTALSRLYCTRLYVARLPLRDPSSHA